MALACPDEEPADLGQRGTLLLLPPGQACAQSTEYSWKHLPRLLEPGQCLQVDSEERCLTLRQGRRVLVQMPLRPLAFRLFVGLLWSHQQGKTCSYPVLLAMKAASEAQIALLLGSDEARYAWFKEAAEAQRGILERVKDASEREQVLKPLRRAIREPFGLGPVLASHHIPWKVQSSYSRGYRLARTR